MRKLTTSEQKIVDLYPNSSIPKICEKVKLSRNHVMALIRSIKLKGYEMPDGYSVGGFKKEICTKPSVILSQLWGPELQLSRARSIK